MFLGRVDEARALYLHIEARMQTAKKTWDASFLEDFAELRKRG